MKTKLINLKQQLAGWRPVARYVSSDSATLRASRQSGRMRNIQYMCIFVCVCVVILLLVVFEYW